MKRFMLVQLGSLILVLSLVGFVKLEEGEDTNSEGVSARAPIMIGAMTEGGRLYWGAERKRVSTQDGELCWQLPAGLGVEEAEVVLPPYVHYLFVSSSQAPADGYGTKLVPLKLYAGGSERCYTFREGIGRDYLEVDYSVVLLRTDSTIAWARCFKCGSSGGHQLQKPPRVILTDVGSLHMFGRISYVNMEIHAAEGLDGDKEWHIQQVESMPQGGVPFTPRSSTEEVFEVPDVPLGRYEIELVVNDSTYHGIIEVTDSGILNIIPGDAMGN